MTKNKDKIIIIFGFLLIFIYLLHYFDLYNTILNIILLFHNKKEGFNQMFRPNRIFKHNNKIILLNSKDILEDGKNPLVFNNFNEYQNYIMSLEEDFKKDLNLYMNKKKINISYIKKDLDIKELEIPKKNIKKYNKKNKFPFFRDYDCNRERAICNQNEDGPFFESIYNPKLLKNFQKEQCKKFELDQKICNRYKNFDNKKIKEMNNKCFDNKTLPNINSKNCKNHIFYQYNKDYIDAMCNFKNNNNENSPAETDSDDSSLEETSNTTNFETKCLLEDYFRENMLEFEL